MHRTVVVDRVRGALLAQFQLRESLVFRCHTSTPTIVCLALLRLKQIGGVIVRLETAFTSSSFVPLKERGVM